MTADTTTGDGGDSMATLRNMLALREAERDAAQGREAALMQVLRTINQHPDDPKPVFEAILDNAMRLCGAAYGSLYSYDGTQGNLLVHRGMPADWVAYRMAHPPTPAAHTSIRQLLETKKPVHILDRADTADDWAGDRAAVDLGGARTLLLIPFLKDNQLIGLVIFYRREVRAFSQQDVTLLESFAEQAVIAMENARLLGELRQRTDDLQESLEHQTATSDVLKVISRSTFDLKPVLSTVLATANRLTDADFSVFTAREQDSLRVLATHGATESYRAAMEGLAVPLDRRSISGRALLEERAVEILDVSEDPDYYLPQATEHTAARTTLAVPLMREGVGIGALALARNRREAFSRGQIALIENFADQAVIAIENTRLLIEQREALERQTATAEVLTVINASPGDLTPVFDAMLEKAMHLCGAAFGTLNTYDGAKGHTVAARGLPSAYAAYLAQGPLEPARGTKHALETGRPFHALDVKAGDAYQSGQAAARAIVDLGGARTVLSVPLMKDATSVGYFNIYRQQVRAFSDKQVALLENFAAQAVIAMENARLLTALRQRTDDLQESLTYQTATSDVLKVISRSTFDLDPVLETLLTAAARLCDADSGTIATVEGDHTRISTHYTRSGRPARGNRPGTRLPITRSAIVGRTALEGRIIHVEDVAADPEYHRPGTPPGTKGSGTALGVPLLRDGTVIGVIRLARDQVNAFTDRQIELIRTFADQAVIAIENTRLLTEQREALERQTATAEVLQVINASPGDLMPVFDAILEKALRVCQPAFGSLTIFEDSRIHILAARGETAALADYRARNPGNSFSPNVVRLIETKRPMQVLDLRESEGYRSGHPAPMAVADLGGARSFLLVPLLKDQTVIGSIQVYRQEVRAFSDKESSLLENFAAQAVIAMENARLINEIRAARDHAEATLRELKIAQANLVQSEKMASLGQLTAGIAHEIKNPLNFVNNFAALSVDLLAEFQETAAPAIALLTDEQRADIDDVAAMLTTNLRKIEEHGKRADGIVKAMLEHSRGSSGERRDVDLNALVDEALNLAYHGARAQDQSFNITLERDFAPDLAPIEVNPQDLTRVFLNMFSNGFYAANQRAREAGGEAPLLRVTTRAAGDTIEIRIRDNGTGIPPDIRDKLFQPFFTTKPTGEGTGLGLSITYDIVTKQHGGTIEVDSEPGVFTEFTVTLPQHMFGSEDTKK